MSNHSQETEVKTVQSNPTLESEINSARINALELKLETLSLITESMWNVLKEHGLEDSFDLKSEMAKVIGQREERSAKKVTCAHCGSEEFLISGICSQCSEPLKGSDGISVFDY